MSDTNGAANANGAGAAGAAGAGQQQPGGGTGGTPAWYEGKAGVDAEIIGHMQSHGWDREDPVSVAVKAVRSHREASKLIGVPPDELIRVPKTPSDEAGWNKVWQRLGAPAKPEDYKFDGVKFADGTDLDEGFTGFLRTTVAKYHLPADAAKNLAADLVKHLDGVDAEETAAAAANLVTQRAALDKNWGANKDANMIVAKAGAAKLGLTPQEISDLEKTTSYSRVMEMFRVVGAGTAEALFVRDPSGNPQRGDVMTRDQATARKAELMADKGWTEKYLKGDAAAKREMTALLTIITGQTQ